VEQLYREFGRALRARRKQAGLSQDDVAQRVGMSRTSITNIEQGRQHVSLHVLYELAGAVGATPGDLLPASQVLVKGNSELEKKLDNVVLHEEGKDWIRRVVSKTKRIGETGGSEQ
jgi:transcriptional regulator with XRE-family HTH domain